MVRCWVQQKDAALPSCASAPWQARDKQMARLTREEALAACKVELANKKVWPLAHVCVAEFVCAWPHSPMEELASKKVHAAAMLPP